MNTHDIIGQDKTKVILAQGKTKIIRSHPDDPSLVVIESKDDITGGNGARHDVIGNKAVFATATTSNVFRLLAACGIPVAFKKQLDAKRFLADRCNMIQLEVVVRREAHGSFIKRNPTLPKGHYFPKLIVEFFLKTANKEWQGKSIPKDDPLIQFDEDKVHLYLPDVPLNQQESFMTLEDYPLRDQKALYQTMSSIAQRVFLILEKAWQLVGGRLVDFKVEFGFDTQGNLLLADVIDNDSWRVIYDDNYIDKQIYRDGGDLDVVYSLYEKVAYLTNNFAPSKQSVIIWRGSERDDVQPLIKAFESFEQSGCQVTVVTRSAHKEPIKCYLTLNNLVQKTPDSIILAYIGASNAAGPMLSTQASVPVITIPAQWQQFPDDVWSCLRTPSNVPVMTVLNPQNALLAGLKILAQRNPALYSALRFEQEKILMNLMPSVFE